MKKQIFLGIILSSKMALAAGGGSPLDGIAKAYLDKLDINPVVLQLAKTFKASHQGMPPSSTGVWNPALKLNSRYDCKVFWVLSDRGAIVSPREDSEYTFRPFGKRLLENTSALNDIGSVQWFSDDPISSGDLIGRSTDRAIFEAIRLDDDGSLLVEIETREYYYVKYILSLLQQPQYENQLTVQDFKSKSLVLPPVIEENLSLVLGYAYCPTTPEGYAKVRSLEQQLIK